MVLATNTLGHVNKNQLRTEAPKSGGSTKIDLSLGVWKNIQSLANRLEHPNQDGVVRRPATRPGGLAGTNPATVANVKPQPLKLHPDKPSADSYAPGVQQVAKNPFEVIAGLSPNLKPLAARTNKEVKLTGGLV